MDLNRTHKRRPYNLKQAHVNVDDNAHIWVCTPKNGAHISVDGRNPGNHQPATACSILSIFEVVESAHTFRCVTIVLPYLHQFFSQLTNHSKPSQGSERSQKTRALPTGGNHETKTPSTCHRVQTATRKSKTTGADTTEAKGAANTEASGATRQAPKSTQSETRSLPCPCGSRTHHAEPWRACLRGNLSRLTERFF